MLVRDRRFSVGVGLISLRRSASRRTWISTIFAAYGERHDRERLAVETAYRAGDAVDQHRMSQQAGLREDNGCSVCVDLHSRALKKLGENDALLFALAAWREAPYYTDAERAAPALAEAETRLADRADAVPDEVWKEAVRLLSEAARGALVTAIALANLWNRLNVTTRHVTGDWIAQYV